MAAKVGTVMLTRRASTRKETVATPVYSAATVLAETVGHHDEGLVWWAVGLLTIGSIALLGVVLTLMTLHERKRHPHP
jgi:hypothetical protein